MTILTSDHVDLLYDCAAGKQVDYVESIDTEKRTYRTGNVKGGEIVFTDHNTRHMVVVDRVCYVNAAPGRPLPDVKSLLRPRAKKCPPGLG